VGIRAAFLGVCWDLIGCATRQRTSSLQYLFPNSASRIIQPHEEEFTTMDKYNLNPCPNRLKIMARVRSGGMSGLGLRVGFSWVCGPRVGDGWRRVPFRVVGHTAPTESSRDAPPADIPETNTVECSNHNHECAVYGYSYGEECIRDPPRTAASQCHLHHAHTLH
jgi:hypothetical protein